MATTGDARAFPRPAAAAEPPAAAPGLSQRLRPVLLPAASILALVLLWQLAAWLGDNPRRLPAPAAVLAALAGTPRAANCPTTSASRCSGSRRAS